MQSSIFTHRSIGGEQRLKLPGDEIPVSVEHVAAVVPGNLPPRRQVRRLDDGPNLRDRARELYWHEKPGR